MVASILDCANTGWSDSDESDRLDRLCQERLQATVLAIDHGAIGQAAKVPEVLK